MEQMRSLMGCRLRIFLTSEEKRTLKELTTATSVPQRTKDRAFVLLLNARGWKNAQITDCLNWAEQTVCQIIHRWQARGLVGLWDATGQGGQKPWQEEDMVYLEQCLQQEPGTYNSRQLAQSLASQVTSKIAGSEINVTFRYNSKKV